MNKKDLEFVIKFLIQRISEHQNTFDFEKDAARIEELCFLISNLIAKQIKDNN